MKRSWLGALCAAALGVVGFAQGCGTENGIVGGACRSGLIACTSQCVDALVDTDNCGGCGNRCPVNIACILGVCGGPPDAAVDASKDGAVDTGTAADTSIGPDASPRDSAADARCEPPFNTRENCGVCGKSCDVADDCLLGNNAVLGCLPKCAAPQVACGGRCVDVQIDPSNCGRCGKFCVSFLCAAGECRGANPGDISILGHDFEQSSGLTSQSRVLVNAIVLPRSNPLRILSYEEFAVPTAVDNVKALTRAGSSGRTLQFNVERAPAALEATNLIQNYDVVVIYDQATGTAAALADRGNRWRAALAAFALKGGAIVALDGAAGNGAMPELLSKSGLLQVTAHRKLSNLFPVSVVAPFNVLASQVVTPYAAFANSVEFETTELNAGDTSWVVRGGLNGNEDPVVIHKVVR
jgi:Stigma-specific protein, Stig1